MGWGSYRRRAGHPVKAFKESYVHLGIPFAPLGGERCERCVSNNCRVFVLDGETEDVHLCPECAEWMEDLCEYGALVAEKRGLVFEAGGIYSLLQDWCDDVPVRKNINAEIERYLARRDDAFL